MSTLFIADLHLSEKQPEICNAFYRFLENNGNNIDALYILGDMFEVWIGDDEQMPLMIEVAKKLTAYSARGIPIYYIHGNRDFMIGRRYAKQASMQLLSEYYVIDLYGQKTLLLHGDTLCLADKSYQKMRKILHNPLVQFVFNALPLSYRKKIGWKIRTTSQSKKAYKDNQIMSVTESEVQRLMIKYDCHTMIHGHTHQVAEHHFKLKEVDSLRVDVGDWYKNYSYLEVNEKKSTLHIKQIKSE